MALRRYENKNKELGITINNLNDELAQASKMINVPNDDNNFDSLINSYKRKITSLNSQIDELQRTIDQLQGENHNIKMKMTHVKIGSTVHSDNNEANLRSEIDILNQRINDLKTENTKYQSILKSAKSTEKVIVKEHYGNNPYGLST